MKDPVKPHRVENKKDRKSNQQFLEELGDMLVNLGLIKMIL